MHRESLARLCRALVLLVAVVSPAGAARAFSGKINYTGDLGPIGNQRPLCICVFKTPELGQRIGCLLYQRNNVTYDTGELDAARGMKVALPGARAARPHL